MAGDALDDLLDADIDIFRDVDTNMEIPERRRASPGIEGGEKSLGLGIDEEIKIARKRKPIVKLDETRLLSQAGIPKLRRLAKERVRFKGKGHEYSDVARLLNMYQLWLDDLYPRAKFADGLVIIEKLGHSRRMQTMRREWINEGKPQESFEENRQLDTHAPRSRPKSPTPQEPSSAAVTSQERPTTPVIGIPNDDDLYSATPRKTQDGIDPPRNSDGNEDLFLSEDENNKQPSEDDLDALLAEEEQMRSKKLVQGDVDVNQDRTSVDYNFDDEMEAMAEMDDLW